MNFPSSSQILKGGVILGFFLNLRQSALRSALCAIARALMGRSAVGGSADARVLANAITLRGIFGWELCGLIIAI